jgi:hypothetical protein
LRARLARGDPLGVRTMTEPPWSDDEVAKWLDQPRLRRKAFLELFDTPNFKELLNEKFIDGLEKRKDDLERKLQRIQAVQWLVNLILALALLSVHMPISLFGISATDSYNFREMLLVIASALQGHAMFDAQRERYIFEILTAYVTKLSRENTALRYALGLRYSLDANYEVDKIAGRKQLTINQLIFLLATGLGLVVWSVMTFLLPWVIQLFAIIDILRNPTFSTTLSIFVLIYVVAVDVWTIGLLITTGAAASNVKVQYRWRPQRQARIGKLLSYLMRSRR